MGIRLTRFSLEKKLMFNVFVSIVNDILPIPYHVSILYVLKHRKTKGFLEFSGDIKWEHWQEMSQYQNKKIIQIFLNSNGLNS